uniref:Uncharacterized protein n=1 Tax=Rhizophora mucronata TaxID=61149 RepID=A0A2P2PUZ2_RHIMU
MTTFWQKPKALVILKHIQTNRALCTVYQALVFLILKYGY